MRSCSKWSFKTLDNVTISGCAGEAGAAENTVSPSHTNPSILFLKLTHLWLLSSDPCSFTMGIKFSRKRDASVNNAEAAQEPAAAQPADQEDQSETAREHEAAYKEDLDVVVMKPATPVASLPSEDCVWERKEEKDGEEAELKDTAAPADPSVPEPEPPTGAQVVPPEPEPTTTPVGLPEDPEAQGIKDTVTVETISDPMMSSPNLDGLGDLAPGPDPTSASLDPEKTSESLTGLMEAEPAVRSQQVSHDVDEGGVGKLLENLELTGSDLVADVVPADSETCDDAPDMST